MPDSAPIPAKATIAELRELLDAGTITVRQLVERTLARIEELDRQGPALHAVIETNPDALAIADALDAELQAGSRRSPLHGIPILLKDNIATTDAMETTAGSLALVGGRPLTDAHLATRVRDAGMVIVGKANLSEWSNFRSPRSSSGWSGRGGLTVNPYQRDRTAWGSSSGSAVAVAADYVPVAVGTETNGSIVMPAGATGTVGIKPTVGLISRRGIIPISHNQDTAGPIARTVADAAALLQILAGSDSADAATRDEPRPTDVPSYPQRPARISAGEADYLAALDADGLRGARIGILRKDDPRPWFGSDAVLDGVIATLRDAGAEVIDPVTMPPAAEQKWGAADISPMYAEFKADIAQYLADYVDASFPIRDLAGLVAFNREHAADELVWFGQEHFEAALDAPDLDDPAYLTLMTQMQRNAREFGMDAMLTEHRLDAIVALTNNPATKIDLLNGDPATSGSSGIAAMAGYPLVTLPTAFVGGMPVGVTFMGGAYSEDTLIRLAYAYEQRTQVRRSPQFHAPAVIPT